MTDLGHDCPCCGGWIAEEHVFDECPHCDAGYKERATAGVEALVGGEE